MKVAYSVTMEHVSSVSQVSNRLTTFGWSCTRSVGITSAGQLGCPTGQQYLPIRAARLSRWRTHAGRPPDSSPRPSRRRLHLPNPGYSSNKPLLTTFPVPRSVDGTERPCAYALFELVLVLDGALDRADQPFLLHKEIDWRRSARPPHERALITVSIPCPEPVGSFSLRSYRSDHAPGAQSDRLDVAEQQGVSRVYS